MNKPIDRVLTKLGIKKPALAKALGLNYSTVNKWSYPRERHGTDGNIPRRYHTVLRELAASRGTEITAEDLVE